LRGSGCPSFGDNANTSRDTASTKATTRTPNATKRRPFITLTNVAHVLTTSVAQHRCYHDGALVSQHEAADPVAAEQVPGRPSQRKAHGVPDPVHVSQVEGLDSVVQVGGQASDAVGIGLSTLVGRRPETTWKLILGATTQIVVAALLLFTNTEVAIWFPVLVAVLTGIPKE
jgi:hypothetical protein